MKIAIIGTGNVGGVLATQWAKAGHKIFLGVRDTTDFKGKDLLKNENTSVHNIQEAVNLSEIILVASPPQFAEHLAASFEDVEGKVIIDATNSIRTKPENYPTSFHAFEALTNADVVKCFNSTGFENMENPDYGDLRLDMFMAGKSDNAKSVAVQLSMDAGFENCYDFGNSDKVELLENFALSWINLAIFQKMGRGIGFKVVFR
ncbi:NADPH-dependent F420 reductase [Flavilitoribacter nigricans]|uniref:NADPH-dependent F420 reductase n=1 Tax=Flavilitoribacter nigricans (strain ATCC 23147 / DSM 23189 / NBRC 102662 / NCIMB 1420 / SS-2) TaxID=1122177 RepID=A0A2D0N2F9_FLAN2|nr:NAD(P)-binding domain-containing protein [Flavilitoribacter nigricans]PHN02578.1 NADPH-dependent F420 reductase [Flavilitoribacter nigricans DSM 23189 = NBRC 102662]